MSDSDSDAISDADFGFGSESDSDIEMDSNPGNRAINQGRKSDYFYKQYRKRVKPRHPLFGPDPTAVNRLNRLESNLGTRLQKEDHVPDVLFPNSLERWGFKEFMLDPKSGIHLSWRKVPNGPPCIHHPGSNDDCTTCVKRVYRFYYTHPDIICWRQKAQKRPTVLAAFEVNEKSIRVTACRDCSKYRRRKICGLSTIHKWELTLDRKGRARTGERCQVGKFDDHKIMLKAIQEEKSLLLGVGKLKDTSPESDERLIMRTQLERLVQREREDRHTIHELTAKNEALEKENKATKARLAVVEARLGI